ncbi:MAG TPA: xanthine dehydrogenase family protein subunit M [Spirochaetia bacterium]|nr:xanthine dehydrogenase family protein subunit M [Spirochaetia bacterium]
METLQTSSLTRFIYARPGTLDEAFQLLEDHGPQACLLAGGTDLIVQLRARKLTPRIVIDLKKIDSLRRDITETQSLLRIGALTLLSNIIDDPRVNRHFPVLAQAAATVGSVQIRNRATLPGNICNASPAADTVPALLVHQAIVNLSSRTAERAVPLKDFFVGPGKTVRRAGEIVSSIDLPVPEERVAASFARLTRRRGVDLASINVCCLVSAAGLIRFAFGAVGPRPILVEDGSGRLADPAMDAREKERLLLGLLEQTSPISDVRAGKEYRSAMLLVLSLRVLQEALDILRAQRRE